MINISDLKTWLHGDLERLDKLLLILLGFDQAIQIKVIKKRAKEAGLTIPKSWNISAILGGSKGLAIRTHEGWEITDPGIEHLRNLGFAKGSPVATQVAHDIRAELINIQDEDTRKFVEEAVRCYELSLYRSAVVMSWLAAIHVLHKHVHSNYLPQFNAEATRVNSKWKPAKTTDDLSLMKEADFLNRIASLSIIGKNVKQLLENCLKLRNGCGHPNSMKIGSNAVAHHLEILLLNVYKPFS